MFENKTYALILESQGFFKEALEIYKKLLKKYPNDSSIKREIERLLKKYKFEDVNVLKLKEFNEINEKNRYEFEKYLKDMKWI